MINFKKIFTSLPALYVIVKPNYPIFTVVATTTEYLKSVNIKYEDFINQPLFKLFTDKPFDGEPGKLMKALELVIINKENTSPETLRYDVVRNNGTKELKYWSSMNIPLFNEKDEIEYIIHAPLEITELIKMGIKNYIV